MPLARFQLRNEYGLGKPELYDEATREDPKAVLDGVAVAGLVGILRQLGDLSEFAAEVFHGLQEQVMTTASRSHNLMGRVQRIEAALPPLEKRVLAQTSHIHFAYTAGSDWHARIQNEQHHFIDNDLPRFIMDSYEECRDPPRLHLLDKFDTGGPGSCLRRYSDPTFFRRVSMRIDESNAVKIRKEKKSHKIKKRRSFPKNGEFSRGTSLSKRSSRLQFSSPIANGRASPTISVEDLTFDSGTGDCLNSFDSRSGSGYIECIFSQSDNMQLDERGSNRSSYSRMMQHEDFLDSVSRNEERPSISSSMMKKGSRTSSAQQMQHEDSVVSVSREEESASVSSSMRKKGSKTSSARVWQHEDSVGSVSHEEESTSASSSRRKRGSKKTSSAQPLQHEDSVGSVSHEEESASISSSMMKKGSKVSSIEPMRHEDSVGSLSHEEESASISSSTRKKGSKASSIEPMQHEDSVGSLSREEESASISSSARRKGSKASSIEPMQHEDPVGSLSREDESATVSSSTRKKGSEASYSTQLMTHDDSIGSIFQGEEGTAISIGSHSPPMIASTLSSVTWEEKTEITELNEPNMRRDQALESVFAHFNVGGEAEDVVATKVDELPTQCIRNISKSLSNEDLVDDIDSEIEHYVDALNTIESESETDLDYQTKLEVEHFLSAAEDTKIGVAVEELASENVDRQPANVGSDAASDVFSDKGVPPDLPEAAASETSTEEQSPRVAGVSADSDCLPGISVSQSFILDGPKVEGALHDPSSPGSSRPQGEIRTSSSSKHQESTIKLAGVDFWTNGGLLGLQPAKPPVFAPSDTASVDCNPSVPTSTQKGDDSGDKVHCYENDEASISTEKTTLVSSASYPGSGIEKSCHANHSNLFGCTNGHGMSSITVVAPGSAVPVAPTAKVAAAETTKENEENSSGVFGLGHRLFVNSFKKKLSLVYDEKPYLPTTSNVSAVDERDASSHERVVGRISLDQSETLSPVNSSPPSPPLEHMRISFRPVNDFETYMLGLRFSNEGDAREKISDMFATFQLVPQPASQLLGGGLDSDDDDDNDTMCQSSPYISDDCLSNHSESNSEQWESDPHDDMGRVSMESASAPTSHGNFKEAERPQSDDGVGPLHSFPDCIGGPGLNLPSFDSIRSLPMGEKNDKLELRNNDLPVQSTPAPPPLPPAEWRVVKPDVDASEEGNEASQTLENATYSNHLASRVQEQAKLSPVRPQNIVEEIVQVAMQRKDQQKSNQDKDSFPWVADGKSTDDKDFLQQIRMKSFNLRRTATAKAAVPAQAATANGKVTAILEKAIAIRQAVGSDDGEDDSWSDT